MFDRKKYMKDYRDRHKEERKSYYIKYNANRSEETSVRKHHYIIFKDTSKKSENYKGMPFHADWNPLCGGSYKNGAKWIIDNLGKRPEGSSLHIVDHEKGFVPGNLEWTYPVKQNNQQMFKIIAQQKYYIKELEQILLSVILLSNSKLSSAVAKEG